LLHAFSFSDTNIQSYQVLSCYIRYYEKPSRWV
jgi:hypothetical protein